MSSGVGQTGGENAGVVFYSSRQNERIRWARAEMMQAKSEEEAERKGVAQQNLHFVATACLTGGHWPGRQEVIPPCLSVPKGKKEAGRGNDHFERKDTQLLCQNRFFLVHGSFVNVI